MGVDVADLAPDFRARLDALIAASGGQLGITSGYRSDAQQAALFAANPNPNLVAPPGQSMHNLGLAADLSGNLDWAHAHAAAFGLYFPMSWEPWHVQPIGVGSGGSMIAGAGFASADLAAADLGGATAQSAHDMLKALSLEIGFVVIATMLAGISDSWATSMLALLLALLVLRGLFEVDVFSAFAAHTTLQPPARNTASPSSSTAAPAAGVLV